MQRARRTLEPLAEALLSPHSLHAVCEHSMVQLCVSNQWFSNDLNSALWIVPWACASSERGSTRARGLSCNDVYACIWRCFPLGIYHHTSVRDFDFCFNLHVQGKFRHFEAVDTKKYAEVWAMKEQEVAKAVKHLLQASGRFNRFFFCMSYACAAGGGQASGMQLPTLI